MTRLEALTLAASLGLLSIVGYATHVVSEDETRRGKILGFYLGMSTESLTARTRESGMVCTQESPRGIWTYPLICKLDRAFLSFVTTEALTPNVIKEFSFGFLSVDDGETLTSVLSKHLGVRAQGPDYRGFRSWILPGGDIAALSPTGYWEGKPVPGATAWLLRLINPALEQAEKDALREKARATTPTPKF